MDCADPRIEAFFSGPSPWRQELAALRPILAGSGLTEDFKWRSPVYTFGGANVAILWGFRDHAALGFFKGVLLKDDAGLLVAPGKNSRSSRLIKFTAPDEVRRLEPAIRDFIRRAIDIEKAGRKVDLPGDDLAYPEAAAGLCAAFLAGEATGTPPVADRAMRAEDPCRQGLRRTLTAGAARLRTECRPPRLRP